MLFELFGFSMYLHSIKCIKNGASLEDASTVEREWLYVTPHSHSPTHYRDVSLFVFPIRENTTTAFLPRARSIVVDFLLLKDLL